MESEVWAPIGDIRVLAQRDTISCVVLRMERPADYAEADLFAKQRLDLELRALRESDYYGRLSAFFRPLRVMTWMTAVLVAAGAVFGGLNTLYAAFASRIREMATLQAIGFGRGALLLSLVQESTLACLLGALLASFVAVCADRRAHRPVLDRHLHPRGHARGRAGRHAHRARARRARRAAAGLPLPAPAAAGRPAIVLNLQPESNNHNPTNQT